MPVLKAQYGVASLRLFGSFARQTASTASDIDIAVRFDRPDTFDLYMGLKFHLEDLLGQSVDLVTESAIREETRPSIDREAILVP